MTTQLFKKSIEHEEKKSRANCQGIVAKIRFLVDRWMEFCSILNKAGVAIYSSAASFYTILSFFPFLLFFFSILRLTSFSEEDFVNLAGDYIPMVFQGTIRGFCHNIYEGSSTITISITVATAIFLGTQVFAALRMGLNSMYELENPKGMFTLRLISVMYVVGFALLIILILALQVFGNMIVDLITSQNPAIGDILADLVDRRAFLSWPVLVLFIWLMYIILPDKNSGILVHLPGAVFSASVWIAFSYLFSIYVDKYTRYSSFYGTMTTLALIMVWIYTCMYVIFIGAFVNRIIRKKEFTILR